MSAAERRERIVDAANRTFAERGYLGASMERIAAAAGVTAPLIYEHFGSKKDLYVELLNLNGRALLAATTREEGFDSVEELLRANILGFFEFVRDHRAAWRVLFLDPAPHPEIAAAQRSLQAAATTRLARDGSSVRISWSEAWTCSNAHGSSGLAFSVSTMLS